jgi:hypothetical protein
MYFVQLIHTNPKTKDSVLLIICNQLQLKSCLKHKTLFGTFYTSVAKQSKPFLTWSRSQFQQRASQMPMISAVYNYLSLGAVIIFT